MPSAPAEPAVLLPDDPRFGDDPALPDLGDGAADMSATVEGTDLSQPRPRDLSVGVDLAAPDLAPPMLNPLPTCDGAEVTATTLYNQVVQPKCTGGTCHVGWFTSPSVMRGRLYAASSQARSILIMTPSQPHKSYVLYKLLHQEGKVGFPQGDRMPPGFLPMLSDGEFCLFYNWIAQGGKDN